MTASASSGGTATFPSFNPFLRHPTSPLGKIKMIICGSILVPIRVTGAIITLTFCLLWCSICSIGCNDLSKPYSPSRRVLLQGGCRIFSRILLFFYGFVWLHESYEIEDAQERANQPHPSVVVVNHIGFAELMYLVYSDGCCFVSKEANRALPFIGKISEVLQSIFVDRGDGEKRKSMQSGSSHISESTSASGGDGERMKSMQTGSSHMSESSSVSGEKSTTEQILERARAPPGSYPPLCICPEGTSECMIRSLYIISLHVMLMQKFHCAQSPHWSCPDKICHGCISLGSASPASYSQEPILSRAWV